MARIPTIEQPQVRQAAFNAPSAAPEVSLEALGGGQVAETMGRAINNVAQTASKIYLEAKKEADDSAIKSAETELIKKQNQLLVNIGQKQGKDAYGALEYADKEWKTYNEELKNSLSNDDQKNAFAELSNRRWADVSGHAYKHVAVEGDKYETSQKLESIKAYQEEAALRYDEPEVLGRSLAEQEKTVQELAAKLGQDSEWISNKMMEQKGITHSAVITQMLNNKQYQKAKAHFDSISEEIDYKTRSELDKLVSNSVQEGSAATRAARMIDQGFNKKQIIEEGGKIENEAERASTISKAFTMLEQRKAAELEDKKEKSKLALQIMDMGGISQVPVQLMSGLSPKTKQSLEKRDQLKARLPKGAKIGSDPDLVAKLNMMIATPGKERDKFISSNILDYSHMLSDGDIDKYLGIQNGFIKQDEKGLDSIREIETVASVASRGLKKLGIDPKSDDPEEMARRTKYYQLLDEARTRAIRQKGRDLDNKELNQIIDDLNLEVVTDKGLIRWTDDKKKVFDLTKEDMVQGVNYDDIPESIRAEVIRDLTTAGVPVTEENIALTVAAQVRNKR
jgi:hypothetical protein